MVYLDNLAKKMKGEVDVGFMNGATEPNGVPTATAAFYNEFGTATIPPRPFFRGMIAKESPTWGSKIAGFAKLYNYDAKKVLEAMGDDIESALKQAIIDFDDVPLSPVTLMLRKMFGNNPQEITYSAVQEARRRVAAGEQGATGTQANPLVWTGAMKDAVTFKVRTDE